MEEPGIPQIAPQRRGYRKAQQVQVTREFVGAARTRNDRRNRGMGEWKLQRSRRQRYLVTIANRLDPVYPSDDLGWRRPIVPGVAPGENAGIQRTADHNRDPGRLAPRQQIVERRLLEEGIAAGE